VIDFVLETMPKG